MRYDCESGKIKIALGELVSIARRGISPTVPYDEDEPRTASPKSAGMRRLLPCSESSILHFGFEESGYSFEMAAKADGLDGNTVTVVREITSSPSKPKREEQRQVRGEAFALAYAIAEIEGYEEILLNITYLNSLTGEYNTVSERVSTSRLTLSTTIAGMSPRSSNLSSFIFIIFFLSF